MFSRFRSKDPQADYKQAVAAYEKVISLKTSGHEARSARLRMAMLCRAHLDKTFIAGAQKTEAFQEAMARAIVAGSERPEPPKASAFQKVASGPKEVVVYLPQEVADEAFLIGVRYQRTDLSAQQAIDAMQDLADRLFQEELKLETPFEVLQFLRKEVASEDSAEDAEPSPDPGGTTDPSPAKGR